MRRSHRSLLLSVLILVGGLVTPAFSTSARAPVGPQSMPGQLTYFYAAHTDQPAPKVQAPAEFLRQRANGVRTQTASITVNYNPGFTPEAQAAFQFAVDIWASRISSPVPITVDAYWETMGGNTLGGAGPYITTLPNFPGAPVADTWYPNALANKLAGMDLDPSSYDIQAHFRSNFTDWYFGTAGNPLFNQYDFVTVVLHEVGHGLGFSGSMRVGSLCGPGNGCWGSTTPYPFIYDRFAVNGSNQLLISSFPNYSPELAAQLTSDNVYFNGPNAVKANGNANVKLYAPGTFSSGSSYSHLDNVFNGTPNALMTFSLSNGEVEHDPGPVMLCMFKDMGWTVTVSGSSVASLESAPGFVVFSPDNVTVMVTNTIYLPLIMNSFSTAPC